jgi:hypothetical protein
MIASLSGMAIACKARPFTELRRERTGNALPDEQTAAFVRGRE